jgi:4-hydroxy-tetrahydrodipicolinate reductase
MAKPLRVIVWGPGGLGSICIRESQLLDEFELVGVYAYSEAKNGVDAGTLIGVGPVGVAASTDAAAVLALDADCVLYTARDLSIFHTDDEILSILAAGHNIVTALPYQNLHVTRPAEFVEKIETVCKEKGVVFHATGVNPDLIGERIVPDLTALVNKVDHLKVQEYWDVSYVEPLTLTVCGFGGSVEEARKSPVVAAISGNFVQQCFVSWQETSGVELDRVEVENDFGIATEDLVTDAFTVAAGTVDRLTTRMVGYAAGSEKPCVTEEVNWIWSAGRPPEPDAIQGWVITIEGRPSISARIDMRADLATKERLLESGNPATEASYTAVVATMLKGVVEVTRAEAGVLRPIPSPVRWKRDLLA